MAEGLLAIIQDPALRQEMSEQSLAIAKTHDLTSTLEQFEAIYASLVNA